MRITELSLRTGNLAAQEEFYQRALGLEVRRVSESHFNTQVGWTNLIFQASGTPDIYHFCFLIPSNRLHQGIQWIGQRVDLMEIKPGQVIQPFPNWNADSVYFYDAAGNILELIARYDLDNESDQPFDQNSLLCVNEIGMPATLLEQLNRQLENTMNSKFYSGDFERFLANGDENGLFIIPNPELKKTWYPTDHPVQFVPFSATIEVEGRRFQLDYENGQISIHTHGG